ncbi:hypothetical protein NRI_0391 [Neorickettsia risticii str. Illinois]|uniref:Uncharacterized protein n=1 Tax=Neorickettsia risticii (strain Illinois) TaxID=434131 RepID=C6V4Q9_NEORI|nr:hypothetical protein NRI_0391 [Neorickettsia risticii str. Illinois]
MLIIHRPTPKTETIPPPKKVERETANKKLLEKQVAEAGFEPATFRL